MPTPSASSIPSPNPAVYAVAVTPSDTTDFGPVARAIYVGAAGNVALVLPDGTAVSFIGAQTGTIIPVMCKRVNSTNTTATSLVALY